MPPLVCLHSLAPSHHCPWWHSPHFTDEETEVQRPYNWLGKRPGTGVLVDVVTLEARRVLGFWMPPRPTQTQASGQGGASSGAEEQRGNIIQGEFLQVCWLDHDEGTSPGAGVRDIAQETKHRHPSGPLWVTHRSTSILGSLPILLPYPHHSLPPLPQFPPRGSQ